MKGDKHVESGFENFTSNQVDKFESIKEHFYEQKKDLIITSKPSLEKLQLILDVCLRLKALNCLH